MQVAVAGMEYVGAAQAVLRLHLRDEVQNLAEALARNGAVHAVVVWRDAADRRKRGLAAGPEAQPLGLVARHRHARDARALEHRLHAGNLVFHLFRRAVGFAQQDRCRLEVIAGTHELLYRVRRWPVHHFQSGRDDAGSDHVGDRLAGFPDVVKRRHDDAGALRLGQQPDRHFRYHHQHSLGTDGEREQVIARRIGRLGAELDRLAAHGEAAHAHDVVHSEAVLQAMHAAGVLCHVAAYGAGDLARRIRRVIQAVGRGGFRDRGIAHAGLDHRDASARIDPQDAHEFRHGKQHAVAGRQRAARQAGARTARHHRHAHRATGLQDALHLLLGFRKRHHHRNLAVSRKPVALVRPCVLLFPQHRTFRQEGAQGPGDFALTRDINAF